MSFKDRLLTASMAGIMTVGGASCIDRSSPTPPEIVRETAGFVEAQRFQERINQIGNQGLTEMRDRFYSTGTLDVKMGICVVVNEGNGFAATINPFYVQQHDAGHDVSTFATAAIHPLGTLGDPITFENIALRYTPFSKTAKLWEARMLGSGHEVYSLDGTPQSYYFGKTTTEDVEVRRVDDRPFLATRDGMPLAITTFFSERNPHSVSGAFDEMCRQATEVARRLAA